MFDFKDLPDCFPKQLPCGPPHLQRVRLVREECTETLEGAHIIGWRSEGRAQYHAHETIQNRQHPRHSTESEEQEEIRQDLGGSGHERRDGGLLLLLLLTILTSCCACLRSGVPPQPPPPAPCWKMSPLLIIPEFPKPCLAFK